MNKTHDYSERFPGFKSKYKKGFFVYPHDLAEWWPRLTGAEQKVIDFVLRKVPGWQKESDLISLSQFVDGTGVSRAQVVRVLKTLEEKGFIILERRKFKMTRVSLAMRVEADEVEKPDSQPTTEIARMIELFREIAPHQTDGFKKSRREIQAMQALLQHYGPELVEQVIRLAYTANGMQYAPTITSPVELEKKWAKLVAYVHKYQDEQKRNRITMDI